MSSPVPVRLAAALVLACGASALTCASPSEVRPPCSAAEAERCWKIPDNPALHCDVDARVAEAAAKLEGFTLQQGCQHGGHLLLGPGDEEVSPEEQRAFADEHARFAKALDGVRLVSPHCCYAAQVQGGCMTVYVDHCTGPTLDELAKYVRRWAKSIDMAHKRYAVMLHVGGHRPRCGADDPNCLPLPYDQAVYEPGAARSLIEQSYERIELLRPDERPCVHDGDCSPACHDCESWVEYQPFMCSQEYREQLRPALCGCVGGHCAWFSQ